MACKVSAMLPGSACITASIASMARVSCPSKGAMAVQNILKLTTAALGWFINAKCSPPPIHI